MLEPARQRTATSRAVVIGQPSGRLLLHPAPEPLESACGYALRLAEANGVAPVRHLLAIIGLTASTASVLGAGAVHQIATGKRILSDSEIKSLTKEAADLVAGRCITGATRFCPQCLMERAMWRAEWDLPLSVACPAHHVGLCTHCERCGSKVSYFDRRRLLRCVCGHDFRLSTPAPAPSFATTLNAIFRPWLVPGKAWQPNRKEWALDRRASLVLKRLIWEVTSDGGSYRYSSDPKSAQFPSRHYPAAEALLADWPDSLTQRLGSQLQSWSTAKRNQFAGFARRLAPPGVDLLLLGLLSALGHTNRRATWNRGSRRQAPPSIGLVTLERVRRALGVDMSVTKRMFAQGLMNRATEALETRFKWVDEEELAFAFWLRRELPAMREAAAFLGCKVNALHALIKAGWLRAYVDPRAPRVVRVRAGDMAGLVNRFMSCAPAPAPAGEKLRLLSDVRGYSTGEVRRLSRLFTRALRREVALFHRGDASLGLANFGVLEADGQFHRKGADGRCARLQRDVSAPARLSRSGASRIDPDPKRCRGELGPSR